MNLAERWFGAITTKKPQRSAHTTAKNIAADIRAWVHTWNADPKPFVWHKTAEDIVDRLAGYRRAVNIGNWHMHRFSRTGRQVRGHPSARAGSAPRSARAKPGVDPHERSSMFEGRTAIPAAGWT